MPFLLLLIYFGFTSELRSFGLSLFDIKIMVFSFSVQIVAFAFSYAFQNFTVSKVNIAARMGDLLVPVALFMYGSPVGYPDFIFSLTVSVAVFFALPLHHWKNGPLLVPSLIIAITLVLQSLVGEEAFGGPVHSTRSLSACASMLFWRSFLCSIGLLWPNKRHLNAYRSLINNQSVLLQALFRSIFTISSQTTFLYVLAHGNRLIAWPILNSVSAFSVLLAGFVLKENPSFRELMSVVTVIALASVRVWYDIR